MYGNGEDDVTVRGSSALNVEQIALLVSAAISFCLIVVLCIHVIKIKRLKKKYPVQKLPGFDFVNTDISAAPFSFLKNIFWRSDISLTGETGKQILRHEITHIKQKHSWDKIFMQLVLCFYWINPFYHFIKKELFLIHEFIADEKAVERSDADAFAKMLLTAHFGKLNFLPAQSIFYSPIKRRLIMLTTSKKPGFSYLRRILVLPLIASLVCLFAFTVKNKNAVASAPIIKAARPFVLVVDAGHGGKDNGAIGNGLNEKDVTLKIAEKIRSFSSQYGINVVLTRDNDVYMSPQQKSDFANAQHGDAFISIHINADENQTAQSGFEILLAKNNTQTSPSTVLGSAILQNLQTDFTVTQALLQSVSNVFVLKNSSTPAALIECGYLTNTNDASTLKDDANIELIAKNILKGVAMYANNSFDKSNLYQLKPAAKDTNAPTQPKLDAANKPIYVLNGKTITESEMKAIKPNDIESINIWKDKDAIDKYGTKGKNGVVEIRLKQGIPAPPPPPPLPAVSRDTLSIINPSANNKLITEDGRYLTTENNKTLIAE